MNILKLVVVLALPLSACTATDVLAPPAVQEATAGQDNREIVLPAVILGGLILWGRL